jgi:serine/threonine protein phosphatase PrpC
MMRLRAGVVSHRGLVRQNNEDSYLVRRGLYAVCDGMGGARAGEVASEMACRALLALDPASATPEDLREAIIEADRAMVDRSLEEEGLLGMGTTLTAALGGEGLLTLAHVGDSRAYLLRDGDLVQLTQDHSWVGEMVRRGELTPAQAAVHPHRSVITRVLGTGGDFEPDIVAVPVETGDRLLLCSDGLTGMVSDQDVAGILQQEGDPQAAAQSLIQAALAGGGEDNVTVVVVDIMPPAPEDEPPISAKGGGSSAGDTLVELPGMSAGTDAAANDDTLVEVPGIGTDGEAGAAPIGDDDEILLGPTDRGVVSAISGRDGRWHGGKRGRLGARMSALRSPSIHRPVGGSSPAVLGDTIVGQAAVTGAAGMAAGSSRWTRRRWIILAVAVAVVLAILIGAFAGYNWTVYYIGTFNGMVALFQGLPASILGIDLSSVVEVGTVARDSLAPHLQARVDAHDLISKEEGRLFLQALSTQQ